MLVLKTAIDETSFHIDNSAHLLAFGFACLDGPGDYDIMVMMIF